MDTMSVSSCRCCVLFLSAVFCVIGCLCPMLVGPYGAHFPYTNTYSYTRHNTNRNKPSSHPLHKHTTYFNTPRLKPTIFNNGRYTTNIPIDPHTVTTTDIKANMRHIHTSIGSRHLATTDNNKILRTPPPHISSS